MNNKHVIIMSRYMHCMLINMAFIHFDKEKKGMRIFVYTCTRNLIGKNKLGVCDFPPKTFSAFEFLLKILFT